MNLGFLTKCPCCLSKKVEYAPGFIFPFVANRLFGSGYLEEGLKELDDIAVSKSLYGTFSIHCKKCGFLGNAVRYNAQQMGALYKNYRDQAYNIERCSFEKSYESRVGDLDDCYPYLSDLENWLELWCEDTTSVIDVGGGSGINCVFRKKDSVDCFVFDVSGRALVDGVEEWNTTLQSFDLVYCSNVLEHVSDIGEFLSDQLLRFEFRYLYIEVPYFDANLKKNGRLITKLGWHEHINYFSEQSIIELGNHYQLAVVAQIKNLVDGTPKSHGFLLKSVLEGN